MPDEEEIASPPAPPIIIIKKKKTGHAAHHGGAWKVAYADFVTAMMALFIVLWLMSANQDVKEAISGYFRDAKGTAKLSGSALAGTGEALAIDRSNIDKLKDKLEGALRTLPDFGKLKDNVNMTVTGEGLRLELVEGESGMFFERGSGAPTPAGKELLERLAGELGKMKNNIVVEGHTDSRPFAGATGYGNWELSADRANSARRLLQQTGVRPDQIKQVRGYADQQPRVPSAPEDAANRRVTIIVQYQQLPPGAAAPHAAEGAAKHASQKPHGA